MEHDNLGDDAIHPREDGGRPQPADPRLPQDAAAGDEAELGMEELLAENDYSFKSVRRGETIEGTVVRVDPDEILVDIGLKSEGVIPQREFLSDTLDEEPPQVGDKTLVYVIQPESSEGHAVLSLRRAHLERSWRDIEDLYNRGAMIEAPVVDHNKGGLIVDVKGVRGFVPVSQVLDLRNVSRQEGESEEVAQTLASMNGRRLSLKIIEINRSRNRLILSERAAVQEQRTLRKDELIDQLQPGQVRRGVVSNLTNFGAFVDLGGADGLVHVSELSYNRVNHPSEILRVGQEVDVMVLSVDRDSKKIALSLKRALPDPWTTVEERYHVGQVVPATITKLAKFGAFAKVEDGLEGLIHLTELTDLAVQDPEQVVKEGQDVDVKIIHINTERRRLGLSVRQAGSTQLEIQSFGETDEVSPFADNGIEALAEQDGAPEADVLAWPETELPLERATEQRTQAEEEPVAETITSQDPAVQEADNDELNDSTPTSPIQEETADEQPSSAAEPEPADSSPVENEPPAATSEEITPVSAEESSPYEGDEQPEVASAAREGTASK
jgi:small subunit ribosomal protein S1